jgi:hypothetical protein
MKPAPIHPPDRLIKFARFLALWVAFMLVIVLHSMWLDTQPESYQDGGFWRNLAFVHMGYLGIAINGAFNALLVLVMWGIGVSMMASAHRWVESTFKRMQRPS